MSKIPQNPFHDPALPSAYEELCRGRLRWDLLYSFPEQRPADRAIGDDAVAEIRRFLAERLDPEALDATRTLPGGFVEALRSAGYLNLLTAPDLGGRGFSLYNAFRVVTAAAAHSVPVAMIMAAQAALGVDAYLEAIPPGPLREFVRRHVEAGSVSGTADTEPMGAANQRRWTTAEPTEDGAAFLLSGEKVYIGNGPIAGVLAVSATVREGDRDAIRIFFVDTSSPGFRVKSWIEFMGLKGFPNGALTLDRVRVPRERMLVEEPGFRLTRSLGAAIVRGRMYLITAPSLAISRRCLDFARDFVRRRAVDGLQLGGYEIIQRMLATSLADAFAIEAVAEWCLLASADREVNLESDRVVAKNVGSVACWRVVENTMALLAAEGFETAASKARRGARPLPMERLFRDARGLRISGGVDFQMDNWTAQLMLFPAHYAPPADDAEPPASREALARLRAALSPANRAHLRFVQEWTARLARRCGDLARRHDSAELYRRDGLLIALGARRQRAVLHEPGARPGAATRAAARRRRRAGAGRRVLPRRPRPPRGDVAGRAPRARARAPARERPLAGERRALRRTGTGARRPPRGPRAGGSLTPGRERT
uniref:Acyl-CoA dehydrogenase n=1 Tax=uncultured bacterium AB_1383 TaxID=1630010 RepID=A0A0E3JHV3_9BACT|nr:acyl-CoA dehydrogenase [uncultured bacterium AB_1383]